MREIQASEAKAKLANLLDQVERGETVVITRHGRAIARLAPEAHYRRDEIDQAVETIKSLRRRTGTITTADLLSSRHEGHKYRCRSSWAQIPDTGAAAARPRPPHP